MVLMNGLCAGAVGLLCFLRDWGFSSAGRAPALQAGGQRFDPVKLHHYWSSLDKLSLWLLPAASGLGVDPHLWFDHCLLKKKKVCTLLMLGACSAYIVKRRLIWRLPGILAIPWIAEMSEPSPDDPCYGLAGRNLGKDWR